METSTKQVNTLRNSLVLNPRNQAFIVGVSKVFNFSDRGQLRIVQI